MIAAYTLGILIFSAVGPLIATKALWISDVANNPLPYAMAPFVLGVLAGPKLWRSVVAGLFICVAMVVVFYVADDASSPYPFNVTGLSAYFVQALVAGPVFGLLGGLSTGLSGRVRVLAVSALCLAALIWQVRSNSGLDLRPGKAVADVALIVNVVVWSMLVLLATRWSLRSETAPRRLSASRTSPTAARPN